jgi:hypothetical protein
VLFGRNRESRSREAAGRRNWPEAVPKKMRGEKRLCTGLSQNRCEEQVDRGDVRSQSAFVRRTKR